jgi:hypothetical protein
MTPLCPLNKHAFLKGYLEGEPKMLVDGIAVTATTCEETKKILHARYGDKNHIIQAHLDYLEEINPIRFPSPEALNTTYIECNRRIQALCALGEDVNGYGRVLAAKILRAFPDDICRRCIIHVKRAGHSEGDMKLMEFLGEEVDGALTTQKIRGETSHTSTFTPTTATFHVHSKAGKAARSTDPFCMFCEFHGHWAQDCRVTDVKERIEKLKAANRCFVCLNRGHHTHACGKRGKVFCSRYKKGHHRSLCMDLEPTARETSMTTSASVGKVDVASADFTYLQTARVWVTGPTGLSKLIRSVLDGGSQCSFVAKSIIENSRLEVVDRRDLSIAAFETCSPVSSPRRFIRFSMKGISFLVYSCNCL